MSRYIDLNYMKGYINAQGLEIDTTQDFLMQQCIDNAESAIDSYCRRDFVGAAGTRFFNRYDQGFIRSNTFWLEEDLFSLTALTLGDGQTVPLGSVWLQPREGPPYRGIQLKSAYVFSWNTDQDMLVMGTWGYGTVAPPDIQQATVEYAVYLYRAKDVTPNDQIGYEQGAGVQPMGRGMPDGVRWKLSPYRSRSGGVI